MNNTLRLWAVLLAVALLCPAAASGQSYKLRGYGVFTQSDETHGEVVAQRFTFTNASTACTFASKLYSDFELSTGNHIDTLTTARGPLDVVVDGAGGCLAPVCAAGGNSVVVLIAHDKAALTSAVERFATAPPLRRALLTHPLFMDKWDRYSLGVWQGIGDFSTDPTYHNPDEFYRWMGEVGLNPQINMHRYTIDGAVNDNSLTWLRSFFTRYSVKFQFVEWLINNPELYNRNPFLGQTINPHVATRWDYYGEDRLGNGPLRQIQNATYAGLLQNVDGDPNQMAVLDPDGEIGPFLNSCWGASGPIMRRQFVSFLRDVRKLSLEDVSMRYYGQHGRLKSWDDVTLVDWRDFFGWTAGAVDLAGEWRFMRDDNQEGYSSGWARTDYDDSDWVRLYYPGDSIVYSLVTPDRPLWMRKTVNVAPKSFTGNVYLSVAPLSQSSVQVFVNGHLLGSLDPRFHTARTCGQFDVTREIGKSQTLSITLRLASGDAPNGPIFLTTKKLEPFPTSDPHLNARRWDHMEFIDWDAAQGVDSTLKTVRSIDPDRPIKVHAYDSSPWGWQVVARYGGYSHHTGSGPDWNFTIPHQFGASRMLQDSSEPGGPVNNLRDLKGLFGNLISMGKNAHDYFINLSSISGNPQMRAYFEQKMPAIKLMGRANAVVSSIAVIHDPLNSCFEGDLASEEDWRHLVSPERGGEIVPFLDSVRLREGNLNGYRTIVDPGVANWDTEEEAALRAYVSTGGILVLNSLSGRSNFITRGNGDGPGCRLAGVHFGSPPNSTQTINFTSDDTLFGQSLVSDRVDTRYGVPAVSLVADPGGSVTGTWPDGSPALVRRQIGSGAVYMFGGNICSAKMVNALADHFGPPVWARAEGGYDLLRTLLSNNGCEDLLMIRGKGGRPTTVRWTFDYTPSAIYDPVTGKDIDARVDGHTATFTATIDDWDFQWFASRRPSPADSFNHWLTRQSQIWSGVTQPQTTPQPAVYRHLDLNHGWSLAQTASADEAKGLMSLDDTKAGLKPTELILWSAPDSGLKPISAALYRKRFDLPAEWKRDSIFTLAIRGQIHDAPLHGMDGRNEIYLNGAQIWAGGKLDSQNIDVTSQMAAAGNRLEIVHEGGGIMPSIMLIRSAKPVGVIDLTGKWEAVTGLHTETPVVLPGAVSAAFVYRDITVPASAIDKEIWLRVEGSAPFVVINGRLRYWDTDEGSYAKPSQTEIDVTPDIRFGQPNRIAFGSAMFGGWHPAQETFTHIDLAFYKPGAWSPDGKGTRSALSERELASVASDLSTVQFYPMVNPAVAKSAAPLISADAMRTPLALPTPILDVDLHPLSGIAADRGPNHFPVIVSGGVAPFSEAGGKITGVSFKGECAAPGTLLIRSNQLRRAMAAPNFTMRVWVKPMAIDRSGGTLADWIDYVFHWTINDTTTSINLADPPGRRLAAESVIRQREWQCLTLVIEGTKATLYVNGITVGAQEWNRALDPPDAPFCLGSVGCVRDFLNAKLSAFTIYGGALDQQDVAKLYLQERDSYTTSNDAAWPENDVFRLAFDGANVIDAAEIPASIEVSGSQVRRDDGPAYLSFSGVKSYMLIHDHPRARHYSGPFSVVWEMRRDVGAHGMVFRHHHILCLDLATDGKLTFDANIGRHNFISFPGAVPSGQWVRLMLTFDGSMVRLYRDGALIGEKAYTAGFATNDYPISIFADRTYRFPDYGNIRGDLREFRLVPGILIRMPEPLAH